MTGGTLPAQTWKEIMAYAHQGLEIKPPYGIVAPAPPKGGEIAANAPAKDGAGAVETKPRQVGLSPKSGQIILEIGALAREAHAAAVSSPGPSSLAARSLDGAGAPALQ